MRTYFGSHNHTTIGSNIRLLDSINKVEDLIDKAIELGLSGIAITDHESLSAHITALQHYDKIKETHPNFKLALGNEIYLTDDRRTGQKYFHFILIAKDAIGHRALRELSSQSWFYSYSDRGMERVPTLKSELSEIVKKFRGHLIATTACIGGELPTWILKYTAAKKVNMMKEAVEYYQKIESFIKFCLDLFGEDFYIECAPGTSEEQILVNQVSHNVAKYYNIPMIVATDAHYLTKAERPVHKAYLNSKEGDREVDSFYEYTYLMNYDELEQLLKFSFGDDIDFIDSIIDNTRKIESKIESYTLAHHQDIPKVEVKNYPKSSWWENNNPDADDMESYPNLKKLFTSEDVQNRYWVNECWNKLNEIGHGWKQYKENGDDRYLKELEEEARVKSIISEKLETNMFRYPNTLQHYIDMIWDCGSTVGAGRGSSCAALNHYLLGITQLDPIEWNLPFFRYLNDERIELGDIDIDVCPSKCDQILTKIREERKSMFNEDVPEWAKENLGCVRVATFGTEATKSAILAACRGYRSPDYPTGIDIDEAQYMASLIPQERGFLWTINDVVEGNPDKGRQPVKMFIEEVNNYPGLLDIIKTIEGVENKRSSHASGVVLYDGDPFEKCAFMKTPKGVIITQWSLHDIEYMGNVKYDFLVTEVQDKIVQTVKFLQEYGEIEKDLSLREVYNKYLHPNVLPIGKDSKIWKALSDMSVINVFQFDSQVGSQVAKRLKPETVQEMSDANGLIRLMGEEGKERPLDKYYRYKNDISLWYEEMDNAGLTKEEQKTLEPYFLSSYGVPPSQEQLMWMLMDPNICNFSLADANLARKIVGKKQMSKIPALKEQVLNQAKSKALGSYVWHAGVGPQMGYSFSLIHSLAYSFVGVQTLYLATYYPEIYWDAACLVVNSGSLEDTEKESGTNYEKMARAIGDIKAAGIEVSLIDINKSQMGFIPDVENNRILFGLKGVLNINDNLIKEIIENRPYTSFRDFEKKVKINKTSMISLIKGGAFDSFYPRAKTLGLYLWSTCDKKSRLTLANLPMLLKNNLIPLNNDKMKMAYRVFEFNRYLKAKCKLNSIYYLINEPRSYNFLIELNKEQLLTTLNENTVIKQTEWDKIYQSYAGIFRDYIKENAKQLLDSLNQKLFTDEWNKYATKNSLSAWEMEVLCFYFHDHELKDIDFNKYGIKDFSSLPSTPVVESSGKNVRGQVWKRFKLSRICGTCIAKDKVKSIVSLLTPTGVVNVKFRKDYFALFDKQISQKNPDGTKTIMEKSWFNRGSMIVVTGFRSEDSFIPKKYNNTQGHQLYKIDQINGNEIILRSERYSGGIEDDAED